MNTATTMEETQQAVNGGIDYVQDYWNIQEPSYYRPVGTDEDQFLKIYQQTGFQPAVGQTDWHFRMSDLNSFYLMSQSFFTLDFNIFKKDNFAIGTVDETGARLNYTIPNDVRNLFKYAQLELNNVAIESNSQAYWIWANIDRAFMSSQYIHTAGSLMGAFIKDVMYDNPAILPENARYNFAIDEPLSTSDVQRYNGDYARLQTFTKHSILSFMRAGSANNSRQCSLRVAMSDMFQFYRYWTKVQKGLDTSVKLQTVTGTQFIVGRRRDEARTNETGNLREFSWAGNGMVWWVRNVRPTPTVWSNILAFLQTGREIFVPFETARTYNFTSTSSGTQSFRIVNESSRPTKMIVTFQRTQVATTDDDPSLFQMPEGFTSFSAEVNGKKVPTVDVRLRSVIPPPKAGYNDIIVNTSPTPNEYQTGDAYTNFDFTELYQRYLDMTQTYNGAHWNNYSKGSGSLGYLEFAAHSPFVCFDLSARSIGEISGSNSNITLSWTSTVAPSEYTMYATVWTERVVSLNMAESASYVAIR